MSDVHLCVVGNRWVGSAGMSRIPSIRRSYVVSQIGLIVVLLMAKTHNPSIRLCCDLFQMETRAVLMVLPGTISSEHKIILEKYLFKYSQDQPLCWCQSVVKVNYHSDRELVAREAGGEA